MPSSFVKRVACRLVPHPHMIVKDYLPIQTYLRTLSRYDTLQMRALLIFEVRAGAAHNHRAGGRCGGCKHTPCKAVNSSDIK
jgi:hypothetical protein